MRGEVRAAETKKRGFRVVAVLLVLVGASFVLTGCATTEEDQMNYSERPWNTPRDWETGLPSTLNQGR